MKILVLHSDYTTRHKILTWIQKNTRHVAIAEPFHDLAMRVAQFEPDLVLLPRFSEDQVLFPNIGFTELPEDMDLDIGPNHPLPQLLKHAAKIQKLLRIPAHGYAGTSQKVIVSPKFPYSISGGAPAAKPRTVDVNRRSEEAAQLLQQLQTASQDNRHERARRYLSTVRRFNRGLKLEMAHGLVQGSCRLVELRDQIARWLTVFAHYLEGVELDYCPTPQYASQEVAYIHHSMPLSHRYALMSVLRVGVSPSINKQILEALAWEYDTSDSECDQAEFGCRLLGLNCYLAQAAAAQVKVMEELLYSENAFDPQNQLPRVMDRQIGLYCEFWGFSELSFSRSELRAVMESHHSGAFRVTHPISAPTFQQFLAEL